MGKLNALFVKTAKPGKYGDGNGLWLTVDASGSKRWTYRYMLKGKAREMGLGSYPLVSLAEARGDADKYRKILKSGADPIEHRDAANGTTASTTPTFTQAAAAYILAHRRGWKNRKHAHQWVSTMKTYARPTMGAKAVDQIGTDDVLRVLKPIWGNKTETAKRVQSRIESILDYATSRGWRSGDNPGCWRGHLANLLVAPKKVTPVVRHPAMPYDEVPAFYAELTKLDSISSLALRFLILTACRTGEVLGATWDEISLDARLWTIPAARMKARREHRVPLSEAAMSLVQALPHIVGNDHLFVGARYGRPLSNMALLQLMRGMGYGVGCDRGAYVPHGFRSAFRDWSGEVSSFPRDVCEMALAHVIENKTEAAYRRGDLLQKRREMMNAWSAYVAG